MVRTANTIVDRSSAVKVSKKTAPTFDVARSYPQPYLHRTDSSNNIANSVRNVEKSFEDAARTGKLLLPSKKLKDFPCLFVSRYDLRDTTAVDLSKNQLNEVPVDICQFSFMETFSANENIIKHVPESFAMLNFLLKCDLSRNQLASFPHCLCRLQSLQILDLSYNNISSLPATIERMRELEQLNMASNALSYLPNEIGHLHKLKSIQFNMNNIAELPDSFCDLVQLIEIDASDNQLAYLPFELRRLTFLEELRLDGNPFVLLSSEVLERGLVYIMRVLEMHDVQRQETEKANAKRAAISGRQKEEQQVVLASVQQTPTSLSSSIGFGTAAVAQPTSAHSRRMRPKFDLALSKQQPNVSNAPTVTANKMEVSIVDAAKPAVGAERVNNKDAKPSTTTAPKTVASLPEPVYYGQQSATVEHVTSSSRAGVDELDKQLSQSGMTVSPSASRNFVLEKSVEPPATSGNAVVSNCNSIGADVLDSGCSTIVRQNDSSNRPSAAAVADAGITTDAGKDLPPSQNGSVRRPPAAFDAATVSMPTTSAKTDDDAVKTAKYPAPSPPDVGIVGTPSDAKPPAVDTQKRKPAPEAPAKKPIQISSARPIAPTTKPAVADSSAAKNAILRRTSGAAAATRAPPSKPIAQQSSIAKSSAPSSVSDHRPASEADKRTYSATNAGNIITESSEINFNSSTTNTNNTREFLKWHEQIRTQQREHAKRFAIADSKGDAIYLYKSLDGEAAAGENRKIDDETKKCTDRRSSADAVSSTASSKPLLTGRDEFNPNFTIRRQFEHVKEEVQKLMWLQKVFESRLNCTVSPETDFISMLSDGVCLCRLANACRPGIIPTQLINCLTTTHDAADVMPTKPNDAVPNPSKNGPETRLFLSPVKAMKNIELFLDACRQVGIPQDKLCSAADVLECKHIVPIATTVEALLAIDPDSAVAPSSLSNGVHSDGINPAPANLQRRSSAAKPDSSVSLKNRQISPASSSSALSIRSSNRQKHSKTSAGTKSATSLSLTTKSSNAVPTPQSNSKLVAAHRSYRTNSTPSTTTNHAQTTINKIRSPANLTVRKLMPPTKLCPVLSSMSSCSSSSPMNTAAASPKLSTKTASCQQKANLVGRSDSSDGGLKPPGVSPRLSKGIIRAVSVAQSTHVPTTAQRRRRVSSSGRKSAASRSATQQPLVTNKTLASGDAFAVPAVARANGATSKSSALPAKLAR